MKSPTILLVVILCAIYAGGQETTDTPPTPVQMCNKCICSSDKIDCINQNLNDHFDVESWPTYNDQSKYSVYFDSNHIVNLTKFPTFPIRILSLKSNRITSIEDEAFRNLTHLEELDLSGNSLTSDKLGPQIFQGIYSTEGNRPLSFLRVINLADNALHSLNQDLFEHVPGLEVLNLSGNEFKVIDHSTLISIATPTSLKVLDLSNTKLKELPGYFLHTPRYLQELNLSGNLFTSIQADILGDSHELKILNLNDNPIVAITSDNPFPKLRNLTELHISYMRNLTRIESGALANLENLEYLNCQMNSELNFISPSIFDCLETGGDCVPNLQKINLNDNALTNISFQLIGDWDNLKYLNLKGNPWVCDCRNEWMFSFLAPLVTKIDPKLGEGIVCDSPPQMKGRTFMQLTQSDEPIPCHNDYTEDHSILIGIFIGIFIAVPMTLVILLIWNRGRNFFFCREGGRVDYSRAFYQRSQFDEDDDK